MKERYLLSGRKPAESTEKATHRYLPGPQPTAARPARPPLCASYADNHISFLFVCPAVFIYRSNFSVTRYRVDRYRVNAGVVALGESLRLIAAERHH